MRSKKLLLALMVLQALLPGCSSAPSAYRSVPDFETHAGELKKLGIVIDAHVDYKPQFFGNDRDDNKSSEMSAQGTKNLTDALVRELAANGYTAVVLPPDDDARALLKQYKIARGDIDRPFPLTKGEVAGVAPLPGAAALAAKTEVDDIVIVSSANKVLSAHAQNVAKAVAIVAAAVLVALLATNHGTNVGSGLGGGHPTYNTDFAVVDKSGTILFYGRNNLNLMDANDVSEANAKFSDDLTAASRGE